MNSKKKRLIASVICVGLILATGYFSGGLSAVGEAIHNWTNKAEDVVAKDVSYALGEKENPMLVLEVVPSPEMAQIGYFFPGCEPIDMDELAYDDYFIQNMLGGLSATFKSAYSKFDVATEYCFYDQLPSLEENEKLNLYDPNYEVDETIFNRTDITHTDVQRANAQWSLAYNNEFSQRGDYVEVGEGMGNMQDDGTNAEDKSSVRYVGEGKGNMIWVPSETGSVERKNTDGSLFKMKYLDIEHNNEIVPFVYGVDKTVDNFSVQVVTMTPTELEKHLDLIDKADLITIHGGSGDYGSLPAVYKYCHPEETELPTERTFFYNSGRDLTYNQVIRLAQRMASDNPAALILDKTELLNVPSIAERENNAYKLAWMMFTYKPDFFWQNFGEFLAPYEGADGTDKVEYIALNREGDRPPSKFWGLTYDTEPYLMDGTYQYSTSNPFLFLPDADPEKNLKVCLLDQVRYYNINAGSHDVFEKIFTYQGDTTMVQALLNPTGTIAPNDITDSGYNTFPITADAFTGEYLDRESISYKEALKYILSSDTSGGIKQRKLRILEVQPWNDSFIYGADGWKVYYQNILHGYHPKTTKKGSWLDDEDLLSVDTMPIWQFVGSTGDFNYSDSKIIDVASSDDLTAKYDIIIFGCLGDKDAKGDSESKHWNVNDSSLNGVLYSAVGDLVSKGNSDEEGKNNSRYQGNDLTLKKLLELEDFLAAGKMVVFDRKLNSRPSYVDDSSLMHALMTKSCTGQANRKLNTIVRQSDMVRLLQERFCEIQFAATDAYPTPYGYTETTKGGLNGVIVNERYNAGSAFSYKFKIAGKPGDTYSVMLHVDANGDGVYGGSLKETSMVSAMNNSVVGASYVNDAQEKALRGVRVVDAAGGAVSVDSLIQGKEYTASVSLPASLKGIIPWKLEVQSNSNNKLRSSTIGYSAVKLKATEKEKINVLQMHLIPNMHWANSTEKTRTFDAAFTLFTTDYVDIGDTGKYVDEDDYYVNHSKPMNDVVFEGMPYDANKKITAQHFRTYLDAVEDFDVQIQFLYNSDWCTLFYTNKNSDSDEYKEKLEDFKNFLGQYDMLVLGFMDDENYTTNNLFHEALDDFIAQGKSVIFSHDMVKDSSYGAEKMVHGEWLRNITGQNKTYYNLSGSQFVASKNKAYLNGSAIKLSKDEMFRDNDTTMMMKQLTGANDGVYSNYQSGKNYGRESKLLDKLIGWKSEEHGFGTSYVKLVNNGQITHYPYEIDDVIEVLQTHSQYFKLDLEPMDGGDVNVWATLTDRYSKSVQEKYGASIPASNKTDVYSSREGDVTNGFYIYTKGNVTYTGLGHNKAYGAWDKSCLLTQDEIKLFVNTMISSYRQQEERPRIYIANADATSKNGTCALFYMDFDEAAQSSVSGKVVTKDEKQYVKIDFYVEDPSLVPAPDKKYYMYLTTDEFTSPDESFYKHADGTSKDTTPILEFAGGTLASETKTLRDGKVQIRYEITHLSDTEADLNDKQLYTMYLPYEYVEQDGQFSLKLKAYAEYSRNHKLMNTQDSTAEAVLVYLPLFDLN